MGGNYLIAHDLGTSGNKATLYTLDGKLVASTVAPYDTLVPNAGWAEQNPEDWWRAVCDSTRQLMRGRQVDDIAGISFSGQMMGCVCIDKDGRPLMNSIIWADTRAQRENALLEERAGFERSCIITGLRPAPNYTLQKLMWLKANKPALYRKTWKVVQAKDYIIYRMTGNIGTDMTDASTTQALDIRESAWSDEMLHAAEVRDDIFTDIRESGSITGYLLREAAEEMGLVPGIAVAAGAGDGLCATVGAGSVEPGKGYCCMGSSCWISSCTEKRFDNVEGKLMYGPHVVHGLYSVTGTMQTGGLAYSWYQKQFFPNMQYGDLNAIAEKVPFGANGVMFLPYLMGERAPWWDANARGTFIGLGLNSTKEDMLRAVLEGVVLNLLLIYKEICKIQAPTELNIIGGGAKGPFWRQMLADALGIPIYKLATAEEGSSFGAAIIAGIALGIYKDYSVVNEMITRESVCEPQLGNHARYSELLSTFTEAYCALRPVFAKMNERYGGKQND